MCAHGWRILLSLLLLFYRLSASVPLTQSENGFSINTALTAAAAGASVAGDIAAPNGLSDYGAKPVSLEVVNSVANDNNNNNNVTTILPNHICTREETYIEQLKTPSMQEVRIRSSNWCLEFPPRCSNYKTEMREVMKVQNVSKTRTIRFCCDGYAGNISINDTICKPVCRGGCGRGNCQLPDVCSCDAGYMGKHCTQRCDHDHWGDACKNLCRCENGAVCDNKSGLCHCTTGWTGEFCELPCPAGTYGVMCRKSCECNAPLTQRQQSNQCHPQTGECMHQAPASAPLLPIVPPNLSQLRPDVNVTHVMIETLNSTIVNITHNLDRIAKNIGHMSPASSGEPLTYLLPELGGAAVTSPPAAEVIVIKQNAESQHSPKIIVHQPGGALLENLQASAAKTPDVIHVITGNWPQQQQTPYANATGNEASPTLDLAGIGLVGAASAATAAVPTMAPTNIGNNSAAEHDSNLLTTLLIILLMIMIAIALGFLYVYRRYHWQKERVAAAMAERTATRGAAVSRPHTVKPEIAIMGGESTGGKSFLKPLPDLPAFTQMVCNKIEAPVYYDSPSSNASIKTPSYSYARKESLYSVISPKSRKSSLDSHLYDEIRYPSAHHQQQQQHISQLHIPPQNLNFLQVPPTRPHKANHL